MLEEEKQFDLELRSMLTDAEETVPSGIWEAVSSRLEKNAPELPATHRYRRYAGYAAVFAIAASLLLFLLEPSNNSVPVPQPVHVAQNLAVEQSAVIADRTVPDTVGEPDIRILKKRGASVRKIQSAPAPLVAVQEIAAEKATEPPAPETKPGNSGRKKSGTDSSVRGKGSLVPLFEDERAETGRQRRVSLQVSGTFGTNNGGNSRVSMGSSPGVVIDDKSTIQETSASTYGVPMSFGLGVRFRLLPRFYLGTGVEYSLLSRTFSGVYVPQSGQSVNADFRHSMHYLGIPATLYFDVLNVRSIRLYVYGGAQADFCVSNNYYVRSTEVNDSFNSAANGIQMSVGGGVGLEFKLSELIGIYVDPGVRYYFNCRQPKNLHTEKPFNLGLDVGLRFNF